MELLPLGPVLFIDTAGIDDAGALGELRVQKTRQVLDRDRPGRASWPKRADGASFEEQILRRTARRGRFRRSWSFNKTRRCAEPDPALCGAAGPSGNCGVVQTSAR